MPRRRQRRCWVCDQRTWFVALHVLIHILDTLISGAPEPALLFHHGTDCPGHTTGKPGASCLGRDA